MVTTEVKQVTAQPEVKPVAMPVEQVSHLTKLLRIPEVKKKEVSPRKEKSSPTKKKSTFRSVATIHKILKKIGDLGSPEIPERYKRTLERY